MEGLKYRRKGRNLAKVNGLTTIPYDPEQDQFTIHNDFNFDLSSKPFSVRERDFTRLRMSASSLAEFRQQTPVASHYSRVTRDPQFHEHTDLDNYEDTVRLPSGVPSEGSQGTSVQERSHFLDKYYMARLKQLIYMGWFTGSMPWQWNATRCRVERWSPAMEKLWWMRFILETCQTFGITCFQVFLFLKNFEDNERTNRQVFMSSFAVLWYIYALSCNLYLLIYGEQTRLYINQLLRFNYNHVKRYVIQLDGYADGGHPAINLCFFSNSAQIMISASLFLRMPYQPWYLFSYIYPKPWYWLIPGAVQELIVVGQCIIPYLLITWIIVAHANTLQFWLSEMHNNNDSDHTTDDFRTPGNAIATFKGLQLLNKCFNQCMAPMAVPLQKFIMASAMIPCGYVLIRSMNHIFVEEFPGILTYPCAILDCAGIGFVCLTMASGVFDLGCSFVASWRPTRHKDLRRVLMSCQALKIWNGRFYFIQVSTTITFFKVVFDIITDCIIAFP